MIYFDYNATSPLDPRVLKAMLPYLKEEFGNPSSITHAPGERARRAVEKARAQVARLVGAEPGEIVFTSGATEANNLALKGAAEAYHEKGNHLVSVVTEHKSVLDPLKRLELSGWKVTRLPVDRRGLVDPETVRKVMTDQTVLVSVMMANNEIGVIQPARLLANVVHEHGALFHCDATQAVGKIPVDVGELGIDLLSFNAHKNCGPKGVGALFIRKSPEPVRLVPLLDGGGHEGGFRSGTLNVPAIVGFGEACRISQKEWCSESRRVSTLRDEFREGLWAAIDGCHLNGDIEKRLPGNLNVSFEGVSARNLILRLRKRIACSAGSACLTTSPEPSYVLQALGVEEGLRQGAVRFSLGRFTTPKEVRLAVKVVAGEVKRLRKRR